MLVYGFVSNYYDTPARAAGVAWCAGFGRLGGIVGPLIGGVLIGAGIANNVNFYIFAGIALAGAVVTYFVPKPLEHNKPIPIPSSPSGTTVDV